VVDRLYTVGGRSRATAEAAVMAGMRRDAVIAVPEEGKLTLAETLRADLRPGDIVLIKGSRGLHMEELVDALRIAIAPAAEAKSTDTASAIDPADGQPV
jgi:UDP-N-acetylmuramoyl-tripeptide--D-alanyl-D-alanine ligase